MRTISSYAGVDQRTLNVRGNILSSKELSNVSEDQEELGEQVEDDLIIARLNSIIQNIRDGGVYDDETKQEIYNYGGCYQKEVHSPGDNEFVAHAKDLLKNYITGWWVHQLIENSNSTEEKLTRQESIIENKQ